MHISAIVVPRVTCNLPIQPVHYDPQWNYLSGLRLADPEFGQPRKFDLLLGIDAYTDVLLQGRRNGPFGTPSAFETKFGWVLAGRTNSHTTSPPSVAAHHVAVESGDDVLRKTPKSSVVTPEEKTSSNTLNKLTQGMTPGDSLYPYQKILMLKNQGHKQLEDSSH